MRFFKENIENTQLNVINILLVIILLLFFLPFIRYFLRQYFTLPHCRNFLTCQSNLKSIGTALYLYSCDNSGCYPNHLEILNSKNIEIFPSCPSAGRDTYSKGYLVSLQNDEYTIFCQGKYHSILGIPDNFPQYDSISGIRLRP
jgi:hypothetical protein